MEKDRFIIRLEAIEDHDVAFVGAKALNLARMSRIGLPVPPGFCVTGAAYQQHLSSGNLTPEIIAALASLQGAPPGGRRKILSEIRQDIIECPLCEKIADEITREYESLGERVVRCAPPLQPRICPDNPLQDNTIPTLACRAYQNAFGA